MAVLGSKGAGEKLSCGSVVGALCAGVDADLRPVNVSQLNRKCELSNWWEEKREEAYIVMVCGGDGCKALGCGALGGGYFSSS